MFGVIGRSAGKNKPEVSSRFNKKSRISFWIGSDVYD